MSSRYDRDYPLQDEESEVNRSNQEIYDPDSQITDKDILRMDIIDLVKEMRDTAKKIDEKYVKLKEKSSAKDSFVGTIKGEAYPFKGEIFEMVPHIEFWLKNLKRSHKEELIEETVQDLRDKVPEGIRDEIKIESDIEEI